VQVLLLFCAVRVEYVPLPHWVQDARDVPPGCVLYLPVHGIVQSQSWLLLKGRKSCIWYVKHEIVNHRTDQSWKQSTCWALFSHDVFLSVMVFVCQSWFLIVKAPAGHSSHVLDPGSSW
jgi:hypothetical protein